MGKNVEKCLFFNTFQLFKTIKNVSFSDSVFMFFQNRSPGLFLEGPSNELLQTVVFGCHFRISGFPKRHPSGNLFFQKYKKKKYPQRPGLSFKRSCSSRKHNNQCTVWTYRLFEFHFSDGDWLISPSFFCLSLCYVLYNMFITLFIEPR